MIEYADYLRHREAARKINSRQPANYPCQTCTTGLCCDKPTVWVTIGDAKFILEGLQSGKIPDSIKQKAIQHAANPNFKQCAFFEQDKERHCSIYQYRPLTCLIYGLGAKPINKTVAEHTIRSSIILGHDLGFSLDETINAYMCGNCYKFIHENSGRIPIEDAINATTQRDYIDKMKFPWFKLGMKEFALIVLANRRLTREALQARTFPKLHHNDLLRVQGKS